MFVGIHSNATDLQMCKTFMRKSVSRDLRPPVFNLESVLTAFHVINAIYLPCHLCILTGFRVTHAVLLVTCVFWLEFHSLQPVFNVESIIIGFNNVNTLSFFMLYLDSFPWTNIVLLTLLKILLPRVLQFDFLLHKSILSCHYWKSANSGVPPTLKYSRDKDWEIKLSIFLLAVQLQMMVYLQGRFR
jgi:hypothetical protein